MGAFAFLLVLALVEGVSSLVLGTRAIWPAGAKDVAPRDHHSQYDPQIGWVSIPSTTVTNLYDKYGEGIAVSINSLGFRGPELDPGGGRYRIVCLGDSFTFGHGVNDHEAYPSAWQQLNPGVQTVNMGQSGYGIGQAMLWYERDGITLDADLVVLAFINHDLERTVSDVFGDDSPWPTPKPRFLVESGRLTVTNQPVPARDRFSLRVLRDAVNHFATGRLLDKVINRIRGDSGKADVNHESMYETAAHVIARLRDVVRDAGARLVVVHLPSGNSSLRKIERDLASGREIMQFLGRHAMLGDVPMLDVAEHFARLPLQELRAVYSVDQHHMSPQGNRLVAQLLDQWLPTIDPGYPR